LQSLKHWVRVLNCRSWDLHTKKGKKHNMHKNNKIKNKHSSKEHMIKATPKP
jgi:hypothetical protein